MFQSTRYSQIALRIGLAMVFAWLGIDIFITHQTSQISFLLGIFNVLVAVSLTAGFFVRWFAAAALVSLLVSVVVGGFTDTAIRAIGLMGGLLALMLWPERTYL